MLKFDNISVVNVDALTGGADNVLGNMVSYEPYLDGCSGYAQVPGSFFDVNNFIP